MMFSSTVRNRLIVTFAVAVLAVGTHGLRAETDFDEVVRIEFPDLAPSLFTMYTGKTEAPTLNYRLPEGYDTDQRYPLLVYVPGFHGKPGGNIANAHMIAGDEGWVVASLPLFKSSIDRNEIANGIIISFFDAAAISHAYASMLTELFERVPNIDHEASAMVGFSNGALAIAVLVSNNDEFVLSHFKSFCLVDHGMFHLTDLHKRLARDSRYLILSGDGQDDPGRELKIRAGRLLRDSWQMLGVDLEFHIMADTGHEFREPHMNLVGQWLRQETFPETEVVSMKPF